MRRTGTGRGGRSRVRPGFTIIELLVVIAILAILAAFILPALGTARDAGRQAACFAQMRQIGFAAGVFCDENEDRFPRSMHSASTYREEPWARAIAKYLGSSVDGWRDLLSGVYHCPGDKRMKTLSYGQNVYIELGEGDDYEGYPQTWRTRAVVPRPVATILYAENAGAADHIMPNFWVNVGDAGDVASTRHRAGSTYVFVDGHAETRALNGVYDPANGIDAWHPSRAY